MKGEGEGEGRTRGWTNVQSYVVSRGSLVSSTSSQASIYEVSANGKRQSQSRNQ